MTGAGERDRRLTFRQRAMDENNERGGPWQDMGTRWAKVLPKLGGESVQAQRMAGQQPVVITILRDSMTRTIDNGWSAFDKNEPTIIWDIQSTITSQDRAEIEALAVQRRGGDDG